MTPVVAAAVSAAAAAALAAMLGRLAIGRAPRRLLVANVHGARVPAVLGLAVAGGAGSVLGGSLIARSLGGRWDVAASQVGWVLAACAAVAAAGVLDDRSTGGARGWRGHLRRTLRGRPTTGFLKLVVGGAAGAGVAWVLGVRQPWALLAATIVIAGSSNVVNGLDVAPGRAGKWFLLAAIPALVLAPRSAAWVVLLAVAGAAAGVLPMDLRERGMLGDAGANLLGFCLGAAVVPGLSAWGLAVAAAVVVGLNVLAETVSFSTVIARAGILRSFDALGRGSNDDGNASRRGPL